MANYCFRDGYEGGTPIPKVMWWYMIETHDTSALNAAKANELYNNELKDFFKRHPEELHNIVNVDFIHGRTFTTNMTNEDIELFKKEIKTDAKDMS